MDPLSDLLRVVRLDGAFFYAVEAAEPWSVETVAAGSSRPASCRRRAPDLVPHPHRRPLLRRPGRRGTGRARPGDVIVFPHGDAHVMSSGRGVRIGPDVNSTAPARYPHTVMLGDRGTARHVVRLRLPRLRPPAVQPPAGGTPAPDAHAGHVERLARHLHPPGDRGVPARPAPAPTPSSPGWPS